MARKKQAPQDGKTTEGRSVEGSESTTLSGSGDKGGNMNEEAWKKQWNSYPEDTRKKLRAWIQDQQVQSDREIGGQGNTQKSSGSEGQDRGNNWGSKVQEVVADYLRRT